MYRSPIVLKAHAESPKSVVYPMSARGGNAVPQQKPGEIVEPRFDGVLGARGSIGLPLVRTLSEEYRDIAEPVDSDRSVRVDLAHDGRCPHPPPIPLAGDIGRVDPCLHELGPLRHRKVFFELVRHFEDEHVGSCVEYGYHKNSLSTPFKSLVQARP